MDIGLCSTLSPPLECATLSIMAFTVRHAIGSVTSAGLAAAAAVHAQWARGSTWPRSTPDELADLVVGRRPFPSSGMCWAVATPLAATAVAVASEAGLPVPLGPLRPLARIGVQATAVALIGRGVAGAASSAVGRPSATDEYRRNDLRIYSPLAVALGAGAAAVARSAR